MGNILDFWISNTLWVFYFFESYLFQQFWKTNIFGISKYFVPHISKLSCRNPQRTAFSTVKKNPKTNIFRISKYFVQKTNIFRISKYFVFNPKKLSRPWWVLWQSRPGHHQKQQAKDWHSMGRAIASSDRAQDEPRITLVPKVKAIQAKAAIESSSEQNIRFIWYGFYPLINRLYRNRSSDAYSTSWCPSS